LKILIFQHGIIILNSYGLDRDKNRIAFENLSGALKK